MNARALAGQRSAEDIALDMCRRRSGAPTLGMLDAAMGRAADRRTDVAAIPPGSDFGQLLAAIFGRGMDPKIWRLLEHPKIDPLAARALRVVWRELVLRSFAARYSLRLGAASEHGAD